MFQHLCIETRWWLNLLVSIHGYFCINLPYHNISVVHNTAIFQDPCIETRRLRNIRNLYREIFQDPCIETRRFSGDSDNIRDLYTEIFQDPCIETRRFSGNSDNFLGLYTQILSRSVYQNTEIFQPFWQFPWFIHADFVKIRVWKHGDFLVQYCY